jgi:glutamine amidotransferase-like uncharacterized protein
LRNFNLIQHKYMMCKNVGLLVLAFGFAACSQGGANSSISSNNDQNEVALSADSNITPADPSAAGSKSNSSGGIALVFNGAGVCPDGCGEAGATVAKRAGLTPKYVTGQELTTKSTQAEIDAFFSNVKVWIMPGGYARNEIDSMSVTLRTALKTFVQQGGGYVGWCAGAFAATSQVGTTGSAGLGLIAGSSAPYLTASKQNSYGGSIEKTTWFNGIRYLYLEGGPYFYDVPSSVEVVSRYDNNVSIQSIRSTYGSGRVFLSGTHPEAPTWWYSGTGIFDSDGSDVAVAADMVKWAAKQL